MALSLTAGMQTPGERDLGAFFGRNATFGQTDRYAEATRAEAYYLGQQYAHLPEWNTPRVALRSKRPRIIVPLYRETIESLIGFIWSGHEFPHAKIQSTKGDDDVDGNDVGPILDDDQAHTLTTFAKHVQRASFAQRWAKEATRKALIGRSCAAIIGLRGGWPIVDIEAGKHCTPTFRADNPREVESLEIVYQHEKEEPGYTGTIRRIWYWFRRTINETSDITYVEIPVRPGLAPQWVIDPAKSVEHNLGFCPVRWWRPCPESTDAIDGIPIIDPALYPLLDAVSYTISQRDRAVSYVCDPQLVRRGVEESERQALDKNPGVAWDIEADDDVGFLELQGTGIGRATEHADDLTQRFRAACRIVALDPKLISGDVSGRFMEMIHDPMIKLASDLRCDLGDDAFAGTLATLLRVIATVSTRGEDVWIPGAKAASKILLDAQLAGPWIDPPVCVEWRPFFRRSVQEKQIEVQTAMIASGDKPVITRDTATDAVADIFNVHGDAESAALAEQETAAPPPPRRWTNHRPAMPPTAPRMDMPEPE